MLKNYKSAYKLTIITSNSSEIEQTIIKEFKHSATRLYGNGIYTNQDKIILICIINKHQLINFEKMLKKLPDTFAFVEPVNQTVGNFKRIK